MRLSPAGPQPSSSWSRGALLLLLLLLLLLSLLLLSFLYLNSVKMCKIYMGLKPQNLRHGFYNDKPALLTPNRYKIF